MEFSWPWRIARKVDESMSNIGGQHTFYRKTLHSVEIINLILMDFPYIVQRQNIIQYQILDKTDEQIYRPGFMFFLNALTYDLSSVIQIDR